jgi:hypothetical protein
MDASVPREIVLEAVSALHELANRHHQAAQSLSRLAIRLAAEEHPMSVTAAFEQYIKADLPDADAVTEVMSKLEGTQSPEWQARRAKTREDTKRKKLQWRFECGRDAGPVPEWAWDAIMAAARERRDVLTAAIACCEQDCNGRDEIATALGSYLKGENAISWVKGIMQRLGLTIEGAKIIPLVPRIRGA